MDVDATKGATTSATSAAEVLATPPSPNVNVGAAERATAYADSAKYSVVPPPGADADMAAGYGVATDVTVDGPDVTIGGGASRMPDASSSPTKRRKKHNRATQDSRKHHQRVTVFADGMLATPPSPDVDVGDTDGATAHADSAEYSVVPPPGPDADVAAGYGVATDVAVDGPGVIIGGGASRMPDTSPSPTKRRKKHNRATQDSRKHHQRVAVFAATQGGTSESDPGPIEGRPAGDRAEW